MRKLIIIALVLVAFFYLMTGLHFLVSATTEKIDSRLTIIQEIRNDQRLHYRGYTD